MSDEDVFQGKTRFKYVTYGISDDREHITWFSFEGEFAGDYPACLDGRPSQTTIKAMMPSRLLRVSGEQLMDFFRQDAEKMELRSICAEHVLRQRNQCYLDLHRANNSRGDRHLGYSSRHTQVPVPATTNEARSKYRGRGAGDKQKARM